MRVDRTQVSALAVRGVLLWLAAAVVWGLDSCALPDDLPAGRLVYAVGLTLLLVAAAVATLIGSRR